MVQDTPLYSMFGGLYPPQSSGSNDIDNDGTVTLNRWLPDKWYAIICRAGRIAQINYTVSSEQRFRVVIVSSVNRLVLATIEYMYICLQLVRSMMCFVIADIVFTRILAFHTY